MPGSSVTSDAAYRLLVEGIVDVAIFMLDVDGIVRSWNIGAQRIKGYAAQEIIGRDFSIFYVEADRFACKPQRSLAFAAKNGTFQSEGWRLRKDGSRFWADVVIDALHDDRGNLAGFAKVTRDITERSIEEEHRRLLLDAAPNGMLIINSRGTVVLANRQADRIFGYRPGAIVGLSADHLLPGQGFETLAATAGGRGSRVAQLHSRRELTGRRHDGGTFPVEATFALTPTARGPVVVTSISDITERHLAQERRRRSENDLRAANRLLAMAEEVACYGHWRIDLLTSAMQWSPEVYRTYGFATGVVPTLDALVAAHEDVDTFRALLRRTAVDGAPFAFESRIVRPDGKVRDVRCAGRGERAADGALVALVGIVQDITARKDAERERDRLLERVTLATHAGKVGIWEWNVVTATMDWDATIFELYGLPADAVPSYALWESTVHPADRRRAADEMRDALAGRCAFDTEFRVIRPDGDIRSIRAKATTVRDARGEPTRMIGINWDITEVRSLAAQLEAEKQRQEAYERERRYEHERKWSTTFQRAVLPLTLPDVPGYAFDAVYEPGLGDAQVGGDWYDAFRLIDGRVLVSIGDVAGSGLEAAVVVGVVRQIMRGIAQLHPNPTLILDAADRALRLEYPGVYVSAWVGIFDHITRSLTYAAAGHPPPLVVSRDGNVRELGDATTLLIGLREGYRGEASTAAIAQDDILVLYTDGVTEATRDVIAGHRALRAAAAGLIRRPNNHPARAIKDRVIPAGSLDDVAILVVCTDGDEADRFIERWHFDVLDGRAAGATRAAFVASLNAHGCSVDECANAEIVFGELIGNIVRHAVCTMDVDVAVDYGGPHYVLHVLDRGPGFSHHSRLPSDPYAENGRGLFLIATLAIDFTVSERADGGSHARVVLRGGLAPAARSQRVDAMS